MTRITMVNEFASAFGEVIKAIYWSIFSAFVAMIGMVIGSVTIIVLIGTMLGGEDDKGDSFLKTSQNTPVSVFTYNTSSPKAKVTKSIVEKI
jgi:hypothetical protein